MNGAWTGDSQTGVQGLGYRHPREWVGRDRDVHPGLVSEHEGCPAGLIGNEGLGITAAIKTTSTVNDAGRPNESRYRFLGIASFLGDLHFCHREISECLKTCTLGPPLRTLHIASIK